MIKATLTHILSDPRLLLVLLNWYVFRGGTKKCQS